MHEEFRYSYLNFYMYDLDNDIVKYHVWINIMWSKLMVFAWDKGLSLLYAGRNVFFPLAHLHTHEKVFEWYMRDFFIL